MIKEFYERFHGLTRAHGTYIIPRGKGIKGKKITGQAHTLKEPVTLKTWQDHLEGRVGLGIVPINEHDQCFFGAIDIDRYDLDLQAVEKDTQHLGLPLVVCRTKSGGAHLYLFLKEPISASIVRDNLMEWAALLNQAQIEIFPKQSELASEDDCGNWINMPYFDAQKTTRYGILDGVPLGPEEFLRHAEKMAVTLEDIKGLKLLSSSKELEGAPPCLQHLARVGFNEGTRNLALFNLGIFCKMKYGDSWLIKAMEFNDRYLIPPLTKKEADVSLKSVGKKDYFYKCKDLPINAVCNRVICYRREFGLKRSGSDIGVTLDGLIKILMEPPMWMINVNGRRLALASTDDFLLQERFIKACVDGFNILPNHVNKNVWHGVIKQLLEKVEELEAPEDTGSKGEFITLLEKFCTERAAARTEDEILMGKPFQKNGRVMFRSLDMLEWMRKRKFTITSREAWGMLRREKAETKTIRLNGKMVRIWIIPAFTQQLEPHDVTDVPSNEEF